MAIIKTSFLSDFDFGQPALEIIKVSRKGPDKGWFEKRASMLTRERTELRPVKDHTPVYVIAMGSMERQGSNSNSDSWPSRACVKYAHRPAKDKSAEIRITAGLEERHHTFVTHGKVYSGHRNQRPEFAKGFNHSSAFNDPMGRVEVISYWKDAELEPELTQLDQGKQPPASMSGAVVADFCSLCCNRATSRSQYCNDLRHHKNAILDDGHQITAINEKPTFIDLSVVRMNADRIGYSLAKLPIVNGSANMVRQAAEQTSGDSRKRAILEKLAAIEKEIVQQSDGSTVRNLARSVDPRLCPELPQLELEGVRGYSPESVFRVLADNKVLLTPEQLFRLSCGKLTPIVSALLPEVNRRVPGVFNRLRGEINIHFVADQLPEHEPRWSLVERVKKLEPRFSLKPTHANKRAWLSAAEHKQAPGLRAPLIKQAAIADPAEELARQYGRYVLSWALRNSDEADLRLAVLAGFASDA